MVGVDASLARAGSISGVVTDASGAPIVGMYVYVTPAYRGATTAADGTYRITGLPAGSYQVRFNGTNEDVGEWFDDVAAQASATNVVVAAGQAVTGVDASLARLASISGTLVDPAGDPIPCCDIRAVAFDAAGSQVSTAYPNAQGEFSIGPLETGDYRVGFLESSSSPAFKTEYYPDVRAERCRVRLGEGRYG